MDIQNYIDKLARSWPLCKPLIRRILDTLNLPAGSSGLDVGCGLGHQTLLLSETVGPDGRITGVDIRPEFLDVAKQLAADAGQTKRLNFRTGDMNALPFADNTFDWVWSADCAGYAPCDPPTLMRELIRVIRPGGRLFLVIYAGQQLLSGHPLLEAKLNATAAGIAPFSAGRPPEDHWIRATGWFRDAGLEEICTRTFTHDVTAPLESDIRDALADLIDMRWTGAQNEVDNATWTAFQLLGDPESPDCVLDRPDYHAWFAYTLYAGRLPDPSQSS